MATKQEILSSEKYKNNDVLDGLLEDNKDYAIKDIDKIIREYEKKVVR